MQLVVEFGLQPLVDLRDTVPMITPLLAIGLIAEFGANAPDRYQRVDQMVSAGGLSPNTEVSGGKVTKRTLQLGGKRNVKIPLMQVAKGYVIHASDAPLWLRWKEYRDRAGYGKALKWPEMCSKWHIMCGSTKCPVTKKRISAWRSRPRRLCLT